MDAINFSVVMRDTQKINRAAAAFSFWLIIILLGLFAGREFWLFYSPSAIMSPVNTRSSASVVSTKQHWPLTKVVLKSLKSFDPWERVPTAASPARTKALKAVPSTLELKLIGTFILPGGNWAVLQQRKNRKQLVLQAGDKVEGAVLDHIERQAVYFKRHGKIEVLSMALNLAKRISAGQTGVSLAENQFRGPQIGLNVPAARLHNLMAQGLNALRGVNIIPYYNGSKTEGYQLKFLPDNDKFKEFGIVSGDVIQKINGIAVEHSGAVAKMLRNIDKLSSIDIDLLRGGVPRRIRLSFK